MSHREIITVQCGSYANFTGQHFWNNQAYSYVLRQQSRTKDDSNPAVLHRENRGQRVTAYLYSPRAIVVDLHGALGNYLRLDGSLNGSGNGEGAELDKNNILFHNGRVEVIRTSASGDGASSTAESDQTVTRWTDYCGVEYDSRTLHTINEYQFCGGRNIDAVRMQLDVPVGNGAGGDAVNHMQHSNSSEPPVFDSFAKGRSAYKTQFWGEQQVEEPLRRYAEECDDLQGFNVLYDADDAFAGFAGEMFAHLNDEYRTKTIFCWPLLPPQRPSLGRWEQQFRLTNFALSIAGLLEDSQMTTLITPLTNPAQSFESSRNSTSWFDSSAILAASIDTILTPFCQSRDINMRQMHQVQAMLTMYGRKVSSLACQLPFPFSSTSSQTLYDVLNSDELRSQARLSDALLSLTPLCMPPEPLGCNTSSTLYGCLRGIPSDRQSLTAEHAQRLQLPHSMLKMTGGDMLSDYLSSFLSVDAAGAGGSASATTTFVTADVFANPVCVGEPFVGRFRTSADGSSPSSVQLACLSALSAPGSVAKLLEHAAGGMQNAAWGRFHQRVLADIEREEFVCAERALLDVRDNYPVSDEAAGNDDGDTDEAEESSVTADWG